jgi:hypothetical protein
LAEAESVAKNSEHGKPSMTLRSAFAPTGTGNSPGKKLGEKALYIDYKYTLIDFSLPY